MSQPFGSVSLRRLLWVSLLALFGGMSLQRASLSAASPLQNPNDNWDAQFGVPGVVGEISAIAVSGNEVYIGGLFTSVAGISANNIAKWNGTSWMALGTGTTGRVNALAAVGSEVYAGGFFNNAGGVAVSNIAKWNGSSWSTLGTGVPERVRAIAVSGSHVFIGGSFTTAGGNSANRIARWDGTTWSALGSGLNNAVLALAVSGADLYAAGGFTTAGGNPANRIARWNGATWSALGNGLDGSVQALAISGTDLFVAGLFNTAGNTAVANIAKWNGTTWSALGLGINSSVNALAVSGSDVFAAGSFDLAGGASANNIARWNGSAWALLGSGITGVVYGLGVSGGQVYAGGSFNSVGGKAVTNIARYRNTPLTTTPPMITAGAMLTRQQGSPAGNTVTIATVSDAETPAGNLVVAVANAPAGLSITNITNTNGVITANVAAGCATSLGANALTLSVSDGLASASTTLTVNVTANTPPVLGTYPATTITAGSTGTVTPNAPPSDNGSISSITAGIIPTVFIGAFSVNVMTGVITITDTRVTGPVSVNVTATDNCGQTTTQTFLLTINSPNTPPTITPAVSLVRQQGGSGSSTSEALLIATVRDAETAAGQLTVTVVSVPTGFTVANIVNTNGNITANILVGCNAALRDNLILLRVSDGTATATGDLIIHVSENQPPFLSRYPNVTRRTGDRLSVLPEGERPFDNGTITMAARAQKLNPAPGLSLAGPFEVNPITGEVIHQQLNNHDVYLVTATATDNCGATRETTFQLTITRVPTALSFSVTPLFVNAAGQEFVFRASPSVTSGNPLSPIGGGVVFFDESGQIGDAGVSPSRGFAELRLRYQKPGRHTFIARYGGDTDRAPSESAPITLDINQAMASVSAASYSTALASEQIVAVFGTNLAPTTQAANTIPLPTTLAGVTVKISNGINEWLAPLFFVSPGQINYLMPAGLSSSTHTVTVTNGSFISAEAINPTTVAPGLFAANATGQGLAAAQVLRVSANGTQLYENVARFDTTSNQWVAVPIDLSNAAEQVFLILYGTGIRGRAANSSTTAMVGGVNAEVLFAGTQGGLAGLDQVNLRLPRSLTGRGDVNIVLNVAGKTANVVSAQMK